MNFTEQIRTLLSKRASLDPEADFETEQCWKEETELFCNNIDEAIVFMKTECTADEFSWISEVFDNIALKSQSQEFVDSLKDLLIKYPEESKEYYLDRFVNCAEAMIGYNPDTDPEIKL